ncbi:MAG: hypothetical protein GY814_01750 [Gammaproteobacteria bacterium]|nr:hypothetical protein [Gammaproteobacteria bacterium]
MSDIIKEHQAKCEAWRKTCEEHFNEALAQGCVPTLSDYSWVSWDNLPKSIDPYEAWNMGAEFARIMVKRQIEQQQAQLEAWEELVNNYISGNYLHPRSYWPAQCPHGQKNWEDCDCCDNEYFRNAIKRIKAIGE